MKTKTLPMSFRILSLCLTLILVISAVITVIFYLDIKNITERNFEEKAIVSMQNLDANLRRVVTSFTDFIESSAAIFNSLPDYKTAEDVLIRLGEVLPDVISVYYGTVASRHSPGGFYIDSSGWEPEYEWDPPNRLWHQTAMANPDKTMIVDPYVDADTNELVITVCRAVKDKNEKITGVISIDVLLGRFTELVLAEKITDDGETVLIDKTGLYIVNKDMSKITETRIFDDIPALNKSEILSDRFSVSVNGNSYIASAPLYGTEWFLVSSGSLTVMKNEINRLLLSVILIMTALMVLATILIIIMSRSLVKPLKIIVNTLNEVSHDWNLAKRLDTDKAKGISEMAVIIRVFNLTFENLKNLVVNIKKEALVLSDIGNDLASSMNETAAAVNKITANIQGMKGRIINQSASVTETHATMEQVAANIDKLNGHVANQSNNVSQASSAIEQMVANINSVTGTLVKNAASVNTLKEASEVGRNGLQEVSTDIQEIARESEGLLEINAVMENIASQTNLLSMNAAIEAAHAGEAGKGFAVVADEIRKLAESSSEQSKTIGSVLKKIKESIDKIRRSTENVLSKFEAIDSGVRTVSEQEENVRNAMEEQGEGSKQVLQSAGSLSEITRQVRSGCDEMHEGAKEVIEESGNLEKSTQEITGGMNEITSGADQINSAVNHVNEISGKNRKAIENLIREVSRFKVE